MDLLVTGFGPFPHVRVNPTTTLAKAVASRLARSGLDARALVVETSYSGGLPTLRKRLAKARPRAVLMLGLAARARFVRVELFARGHSSRLHPDKTGGTPAGRLQGAPALPLRTTGNPQGALAMLRRSGIATQLSASAGRYLCDACYAAALSDTKGTATPVLFVHVPWLKPAPGTRPTERSRGFRPDAGTLADALAMIGRSLVVQGRREQAAFR
ncbi:pyroglutamyl-peptidase I family protein [Bosea sp. PAMC 26642]|uniref:pyroglutamyl-peptidase I family protein n=1 Tax=Bosea sp. (strain PAMC 26642) TaxID=1792307 RepID=UPI000AC896D3|nr:peptidase C15 [Bosea sp. PAMC 26642]